MEARERAMKTIGIVGGTGPESTVDYYRLLIAAYRERVPDGSYPPIVINSIDLKKVTDFLAANELAGLAELLVREVQTLVRAGAEIGLVAANTPHIVFDEVARQSPIPLVSIVEATCAEANRLGLKKLGLFGTRYTMQGRFYPDVFSRARITLVIPAPDEQTYIHEKYMGELVPGIFLNETRKELLAIVERMRKTEAIEGVILAGTELPLLLRDAKVSAAPFLDTARIHVKAILERAFA